MHQVADFPHQGLMFGNHGICDGSIVIETGGRHFGLQFPNRPFSFRNEYFELVYLPFAILGFASAPAVFGVPALLVLVAFGRGFLGRRSGA